MLGIGMNARKLGAICALLAATLNLIGCESSRDSPDRQFQKQVKRAQECRKLQDKLVGDQPLTAERAEEITKTMDRTGCWCFRRRWHQPRPRRIGFGLKRIPGRGGGEFQISNVGTET
jgi:hypothetical protein